jgi:TRAP-type C4-dicarboxylate transport system substrate-binding protein
MMNSAEATSKAYWEYVHTTTPDEFKEVKLIALHVHGPGMFHTTERQIRTPADLRGLKIRGATRQITKLLASLGATPVGMPLPAIPDALSKGTINGCAIPWEVVPSVRVHELTRFHSEFPSNAPALYTATFVMAMNPAKYQSLPPDLKKVIDDNAGINTSAWLGRIQQENDVPGRKSAADRGNTIYRITEADTAEFVKRSSQVDDEWVADISKRGVDGKKLLETAKALIAKHGKA